MRHVDWAPSGSRIASDLVFPPRPLEPQRRYGSVSKIPRVVVGGLAGILGLEVLRPTSGSIDWGVLDSLGKSWSLWQCCVELLGVVWRLWDFPKDLETSWSMLGRNDKGRCEVTDRLAHEPPYTGSMYWKEL
jgi:hypothetical protein